MKMNRLIVVTGMLLVTIGALFAKIPVSDTYTIKGSVIEKSTWKPVEGAVVHLVREEKTERTAQTDHAGKFIFPNIDGWQAV